MYFRNKQTTKERIKILNPTDNGNGYMIIMLHADNKRKNHYVHRLVAEAFIANPLSKKEINHIDYNKKNNNAKNLEWVTRQENIDHSKGNMKGKKHRSNPNTGEQYISYRSSKKAYRVTVNKKEYGSCRTLEEAIKKRDAILKGVV